MLFSSKWIDCDAIDETTTTTIRASCTSTKRLDPPCMWTKSRHGRFWYIISCCCCCCCIPFGTFLTEKKMYFYSIWKTAQVKFECTCPQQEKAEWRKRPLWSTGNHESFHPLMMGDSTVVPIYFYMITLLLYMPTVVSVFEREKDSLIILSFVSCNLYIISPPCCEIFMFASKKCSCVVHL